VDLAPGTRVTSNGNLGAVRRDGPQTRFVAAVPAGSTGTVIEGEALNGWSVVQFDAPWDAHDGEAIVVPVTSAHVDALP
jgi:hypothetical protein